MQPPPPTVTEHGVSFLDSNAAGDCYIGQDHYFDVWQGTATGYVKFPAGFSPPDATLEAVSEAFYQGLYCDPPPAL